MQRIPRHRLCQLALPHDGHPNVEALEVGPLLVTVGADDGVDCRVGSSHDGDDRSRFERVRCCDHQEARLFEARLIEHTGAARIAEDRAEPACAHGLDGLTVLLHHDIGNVVLCECLPDGPPDSAMADDDSVAAECFRVDTRGQLGDGGGRPLESRQQLRASAQPAGGTLALCALQ